MPVSYKVCLYPIKCACILQYSGWRNDDSLLPPPTNVLCLDNKLHHEFWTSGKCWVTFLLPLLPGPLWTEVVVSVKVLSVGQVGLRKYLKWFWTLSIHWFLKHWYYDLIGQMNSPGDRGSIPDRVIPKTRKTQKMVFDGTCLALSTVR